MSNNNITSSNKRIAWNTIFLYLRMIIVLVVNLFTARVLLNALGVEDYGVYNVVAGFVSLFAFLNATLSSSIQRFYNYEGTQNGEQGYQAVYVTALVIHALISIVLLLALETFGLWYVNCVMVIPDGRIIAANVLFQTSILSLVLMLFQIPYTSAVLSKEEMDFYAFVNILDVFLKLFIALLLTWTSYDNLILYGVLLLSVSVIDFCIYFGFCTVHFKEMRITRVFDKKLFKSMLSFSAWNLVGTFAFMLKGQGLNMLLNGFFGPVINAARGVAFQVNGAVSGFSANIFIAFSPQVVKSYAEGNCSRTIRMMFVESKVCFALIAIIIVPVILNMDYLLHLWLGEIVPEHTTLFASLVLIDLLICTLNTPCTQVVQATGEIKLYQMGSTIVNLFLLPFCWLLLQMGMPAESVFISTIGFTCINQMVCLYFTNKLLHFGLIEYVKTVITRVSVYIFLLCIIPITVSIYIDQPTYRFVVVSLLSLLIGVGLGYLIILNSEERVALLSIVKKYIKFHR